MDPEIVERFLIISTLIAIPILTMIVIRILWHLNLVLESIEKRRGL